MMPGQMQLARTPTGPNRLASLRVRPTTGLGSAVGLRGEIDAQARAGDRRVVDDRPALAAGRHQLPGLDRRRPVGRQPALHHEVPALVLPVLIAGIRHGVVEENTEGAGDLRRFMNHATYRRPVRDVDVEVAGISPLWRMPSATASPASSSISAITTPAPSSAKSAAVAAPMPEAPPVINVPRP